MAFNFEYPNKLSQALNDLREQKQLCDIIINVGGRAFHAHKAVLAASWCYFYAMFTSGFQESTKSEVKIDGSADVFEILLQFAYTGYLNITPKTAHDVLDMACYMQLTDVFKPFSTFVRDYLATKSNEMSVGDAFKIFNLAKNHDLAELVQPLEKYLENNVQDLKKTDVFLENASVTFLEKFLTGEDLASANGEKQVLEMVVAWLKHDWENRQVHTLRLFQKVRLGLVPTENLKELVDAEILEIPECKALLDEVLQLQSSKKSKTTLSLQNPELFLTRSTITAPISTYLVYGKREWCFQYYNAEGKQWKDLKRFASLPECSFHHLVGVDGLLYAVGSLKSREVQRRRERRSRGQRDLFCYDPMENRWTQLPSLEEAQKTIEGTMYIDGSIYAFASQRDEVCELECYDMAMKKWQIRAPLPALLRNISAVAFKGQILVYGLMSSSRWYSLMYKYALYVYSPSTDTWQLGPLEEYRPNVVLDHIDLGSLLVFVHKDVCYKVTYLDKRVPLVNIVELDLQDGHISLKVGKKVKQDHIPPDNKVGAFRINDEVFVNHRGFVYNTGIKIAADQSTDVDLKEWQSFIINGDQSNITWFTFDRKTTSS